MRYLGYAKAQIRAEFCEIVGRENVLTDESALNDRAIDQYWLTFMWRAKGEELPLPEFVVLPKTTEEVSDVVRVCERFKIPVVTRGLGSGTQGGAATFAGGVVIDLSRMDSIIKIDEESLILTAEAGINGRVLENALNDRGLMLAHYPSSVDIASLGGYVAARGSGVMSTKYGKAEDMVLGLEVVLPDGTVISTLGLPNHANGPDLLQMFVGSEGTLGIITKVQMRLDPIPEHREFRGFKFPTISMGIEAGRQAMIQRLNPAVIRLYDEGATQRSLVQTGHDVEGIVMVVMTDGFKDIAQSQMQRIIGIVAELGGEDLGAQEGQHWWEHRYDFYKPPLQPGYPQLYGTTETVTTFDKIGPLYLAKKELIETEFAKWGATYTAHFSHWFPWGTMIYDRFYIDKPPADAHEALELHNEIWMRASRINLEFTGMLNEHHGIGFKLGRFMHEQNPGYHQLLQKIKDACDPQGIMNPAKLGFKVR